MFFLCLYLYMNVESIFVWCRSVQKNFNLLVIAKMISQAKAPLGDFS